MPADPGGLGPDDVAQVAKSASEVAGHLVWGIAGVGAMVIRLATYSGPPRPWRAVVLDCIAMLGVGYAVSAAVTTWLDRPQLAMSVGIASGLIGWEAIKHIVARRAQSAK